MDGNFPIAQVPDSSDLATRSFTSLDAGFLHPCRNDGPPALVYNHESSGLGTFIPVVTRIVTPKAISNHVYPLLKGGGCTDITAFPAAHTRAGERPRKAGADGRCAALARLSFPANGPSNRPFWQWQT